MPFAGIWQESGWVLILAILGIIRLNTIKIEAK